MLNLFYTKAVDDCWLPLLLSGEGKGELELSEVQVVLDGAAAL